MKKNICLMLLIVFFTSCESQLGTAVSSAFTNLFTGKGFSSSSSDEMYEELKEKERMSKDTSYISNSGACVSGAQDALVMVLDKTANQFSKIKDKLCSCKAWGTCDNKSCSCEKLCPEGFDILDRGVDNDAPENSLSFNNGDTAFYKKDSGYTGYCWGHAVVTQRFNRLATFNPNYKKPFADEDEKSTRIKNYQYIIDKINNNEPVEIMGFKNLKEFSSDPEVKDLLQESVKKNWGENAMSMQGLTMVTSTRSQGEEYYSKLFDDIEYRLGKHQEPTIVLNQLGEGSTAHAFLISGSGVDQTTGERYLCARDNNFSAERISNCQKKLYLTKEGTLEYHIIPGMPPKAIGNMKVSYTENSNTVEQVKNLKEHCLGLKGCRGSVGTEYSNGY